jgi:outer membrane protein OmpA-like peptidoglycan-associated protein
LREEITIYKGHLECQFIDIDKQSLSPTYKFSKIKLEERFRLTEVEKSANFPISKLPESASFIHQLGELYPIECFFKSKTEKDARYFASEILLILEDENDNSFISDFETTLKNNNTKGNNFLSTQYGNQHGKISGIAYCKVIRKFDENNTEITETSNIILNKEKKYEFDLSENNGCLFWLTSFFKPLFGFMFGINSWIKNFINLFASRVFNKKIINDGPTNAGCLNPMLPSGCSSSGCSQFGCGCLSILLALGFLFWLIWCLLLGKCNENRQQTMTDTKIIHDTVYIEVNKAKIDTIIKNDTIIYEDKTTRTKTSVVSLPKVQFEQGKAKLLESSKEELNKLTKYLLENKDVKAEIIGHTDNLGDDQVNQKLSQERAESVRQYIIKGGVDGNRIKAKGKGESEPNTSNDTPEGRAMNRRVELRLSETEKVKETNKRTRKN